MEKNTYYHILNISPRATDEDVRRAWRALALRWHPDRNPRNRAQAQRMFVLINRAYTLLKTKPQRMAYNRYLLNMTYPPNHPTAREKARVERNISKAFIEILWPFALNAEARHG